MGQRERKLLQREGRLFNSASASGWCTPRSGSHCLSITNLPEQQTEVSSSQWFCAPTCEACWPLNPTDEGPSALEAQRHVVYKLGGLQGKAIRLGPPCTWSLMKQEFDDLSPVAGVEPVGIHLRPTLASSHSKLVLDSPWTLS